MYRKNLKLHFVGIGGIGMSGIAEVLLNLGYNVTGSDLRAGPVTERLESIGARICIGHTAAALEEGTDVVVYSSAVSKFNPELGKARDLGIPIIKRAEMLGELMRLKSGIAISGSHGKTTTTSLVGSVLTAAGLNPTVIVGGRLLDQQTNGVRGSGEFLVAEADESDGTFGLLRPVIAVATNIDHEHLAFFGSFGKLEEAFAEFLGAIPFYGLAVICGDDPVLSAIADKLQKRVIRYGFGPNQDIRAENIVIGDGVTTFDVLQADRRLGSIKLPILGNHMVLNALAAVAVGLELEVPFESIRRGLESFAGVSRRCELLAEFNGVKVIDDYGHHPREISATLGAVKAGHLADGSGKLRLIFQPHRYTRTKELLSDFLTCFSDADEVYITDIYAADEEPIEGVSGELLARAAVHPAAAYSSDLYQTVIDVVHSATPGDIVLVMGAGSVSSLARKALNELHQTGRVANL